MQTMVVNTSTTPSQHCWISCLLNSPNQGQGTAMRACPTKCFGYNALVESKNGSVVRKLYGYEHIHQHRASQFSVFNQTQVYRYVNFHRPCYFPTTAIDSKGKERKKYAYSDMMTPYDKLISLTNPMQYLKPDITLDQLNAFSQKMNDNDAAEQLNTARDTLFKQLHERHDLRA
jgi:hypothetical protein